MLRPQKGNSGVLPNDTLLNFGLWRIYKYSILFVYRTWIRYWRIHGKVHCMCILHTELGLGNRAGNVKSFFNCLLKVS